MKKYFLGLVAVITLLIGVSAQAADQLKTEAVSPRIRGIVVKNEGDKTVVKGSVSRGKPAHAALGDHVHVELIGNNKVLATQVQGLAPTAPKREAANSYRVSYWVEFPLDKAADADTVRVVYVSSSHSDCAGNKKSS